LALSGRANNGLSRVARFTQAGAGLVIPPRSEPALRLPALAWVGGRCPPAAAVSPILQNPPWGESLLAVIRETFKFPQEAAPTGWCPYGQPASQRQLHQDEEAVRRDGARAKQHSIWLDENERIAFDDSTGPRPTHPLPEWRVVVGGAMLAKVVLAESRER
jgi:hypothetical protein